MTRTKAWQARPQLSAVESQKASAKTLPRSERRLPLGSAAVSRFWPYLGLWERVMPGRGSSLQKGEVLPPHLALSDARSGASSAPPYCLLPLFLVLGCHPFVGCVGRWCAPMLTMNNQSRGLGSQDSAIRRDQELARESLLEVVDYNPRGCRVLQCLIMQHAQMRPEVRTLQRSTTYL